MADVKVYTKSRCPYCNNAKHLLKTKGVSFQEINIETEPEFYEKLKIQTGLRTVPQIFINGKLIGGYTDLAAMNDRGELDALLKS